MDLARSHSSLNLEIPAQAAPIQLSSSPAEPMAPESPGAAGSYTSASFTQGDVVEHRTSADEEPKTPGLRATIIQRHLRSKEELEVNRSRSTRIFAASSQSTRRLRNLTKRIVEADAFHVLVLLLIVANAVLLGVEIDVASTLPESDIPSWYGMVNTLIVAFFVLEIAMKFFAYGCSGFWRGPGAGWNIFDFVIVALSAVETALDLFAKTIASEMFGSDALSVVRTLRLARALRGFRAFRLVRHFSALRALILSIVSTIGSLMWTLVLLVILFYSFGVILMQLVTDYCRYLAIETLGDVDAIPDCPAELSRFWSSIRQSMLTLFFSITSGISWSEAMNPLEDVSMLAVGTMLVYITLSVFTILNVVTGVFVNTAIERASADKEIASLKALQKRNEQMEALQSVFEEMNQERGSEQLKVEDIEAAVNVDKLDTVLESLGISTDDVKTLFSLIDADGSGAIDLQEFVSGCMQLHGPAKSMQMAKMSYENKRIASSIKTLMTQVKDMQKKMNTVLSMRTAVPMTIPVHDDVMYI